MGRGRRGKKDNAGQSKANQKEPGSPWGRQSPASTHEKGEVEPRDRKLDAKNGTESSAGQTPGPRVLPDLGSGRPRRRWLDAVWSFVSRSQLRTDVIFVAFWFCLFWVAYWWVPGRQGGTYEEFRNTLYDKWLWLGVLFPALLFLSWVFIVRYPASMLHQGKITSREDAWRLEEIDRRNDLQNYCLESVPQIFIGLLGILAVGLYTPTIKQGRAGFVLTGYGFALSVYLLLDKTSLQILREIQRTTSFSRASQIALECEALLRGAHETVDFFVHSVSIGIALDVAEARDYGRNPAWEGEEGKGGFRGAFCDLLRKVEQHGRLHLRLVCLDEERALAKYASEKLMQEHADGFAEPVKDTKPYRKVREELEFVMKEWFDCEEVVNDGMLTGACYRAKLAVPSLHFVLVDRSLPCARAVVWALGKTNEKYSNAVGFLTRSPSEIRLLTVLMDDYMETRESGGSGVRLTRQAYFVRE